MLRRYLPDRNRWETRTRCCTEDEGATKCEGYEVLVHDHDLHHWVSKWTHLNLNTGDFQQPYSAEPFHMHLGGLRYEVTGAGSALARAVETGSPPFRGSLRQERTRSLMLVWNHQRP